VCQELEISGDDGTVYKLIGPALVKQDTLEAAANVTKRLEYIGNELSRLDGQLKGLEESQRRKQAQLMKLQQEAQRLQQQQQPAVAAA
jgi:prefoldin beta subunit